MSHTSSTIVFDQVQVLVR